MTIYLGHRAEDGREQLLLDHLTGVARYAQAFADSFGAGALAYQIGLAHDAGKYSDKFQRRIRGAAVQVDHSTAGAPATTEVCPTAADSVTRRSPPCLPAKKSRWNLTMGFGGR